MDLTIKAILARFGGDPNKAAVYCHDIMTQYPHLKSEYGTLLLEITRRQWELRSKLTPSPFDVYISEEKAEAACAN